MYVWLAQRLHRISPGKPQFVDWNSLHQQFGQEYARIRDFRRFFHETLRQVLAVYPNARLDSDERGVTLAHSSPPVPSKQYYLASPTVEKPI
jgi:hypothetical protein